MSKFPELSFHGSVGQIEGPSKSTSSPGNLLFSRGIQLLKAVALSVPSAAWRLWFSYFNYFNDFIAHPKSLAGYVTFNANILLKK